MKHNLTKRNQTTTVTGALVFIVFTKYGMMESWS